LTRWVLAPSSNPDDSTQKHLLFWTATKNKWGPLRQSAAQFWATLLSNMEASLKGLKSLQDRV
jgi:hypothetical protein